MLTMTRWIIPSIQIKYYGFLVNMCLKKAQRYNEIDVEKSVYWSKLACDYLIKRCDVLIKKIESVY